MKKIIFAFFALVLVSANAKSQDIPLSKFDKRGVAVIDSFLNAITSNADDLKAAAKAAMPFIHKSEYDIYGQSLKPDRMDFSFKKAWQNTRFYKWPVEVTRVQQQNLTGIGFRETAESGTAYKVWVAKKDGAGGLPAPVNVFFPADGSEPKVYYYGSL